jgi:hypothetical protein
MTALDPSPGAVQRRCTAIRIASVLLLFGLLTACETSQEALSAANQLTNVSQKLSAYYTDLAKQTGDSVSLNQIQEAVMDLPAAPQAQAELETTRVELGKRAALANSMNNLAVAYAGLAGSKAAGDIADAASGFAKQCGQIHKLPGGPALPDLIGQAGELLVNAIREHKLKQSTEAISKAVAGVDQLFHSEMRLYESTNQDRVTVAAQTAEHMVTRENVVDTSLLLALALKQFDLSATVPPGQTPPQYRNLAVKVVHTRRDQQIGDFATNTDDLAGALDAVTRQIANVPKKK